jgi:hypothetical protein
MKPHTVVPLTGAEAASNGLREERSGGSGRTPAADPGAASSARSENTLAADRDRQSSGGRAEPSSAGAARSPHVILFLAANPIGTDRLALDREAHAIQVELERSGHRDRFAFVTRWAAEPLDLLRELRRLRPTVVHFSGHGGDGTASATHPDAAQRAREPAQGLYFQTSEGRAQKVSATALRDTFAAAGSSVKLVVLSACYSEPQAEVLLASVDCVVGMTGAISSDAARSFAIGFYGGLGEQEPVAAAYQQGRAAISLLGLRDAAQPRLKIRAGVDASRLVLAADPR